MTNGVSIKRFSFVRTCCIIAAVEGVTFVGLVISDVTELEFNMFK